MSVLIEFSIFPTDKGESKSKYVARVIKMIKESGVTYQFTPMSTIIETYNCWGGVRDCKESLWTPWGWL